MTEENKGAAVALLPGDDADRGAFERWVSAPPFEYSIEQMPEKSAWPGSYHFISVQLAWCAWREAQLELRARLAAAEQDRDYAWQNVRIVEKARQEEMAKRDAAEAEVVRLRAQRDEAVAALGGCVRAYVNLMEAGRDRIIDAGGDCDPVDVMERNDPHLRELRTTLASLKEQAT